MLAAAGFLVQENFHPLFSADGGPAIEQIPQLPAWLWFVGTLGVGICEVNRIQIGWANPYEKPSNVQALREMQEKELSHGRLGMLAAAGFIAQEAATGKTWGAGDFNFESLVLGPFFKQEAVEVARDAMTFTN